MTIRANGPRTGINVANVSGAICSHDRTAGKDICIKANGLKNTSHGYNTQTIPSSTHDLVPRGTKTIRMLADATEPALKEARAQGELTAPCRSVDFAWLRIRQGTQELYNTTYTFACG
jgi:hypothetical protein